MKTAIPKEQRLIRGPGLEVLVPRIRGVPFEEALRIAEQGRRVLASSKRLGKAMVGSDEWESISEVFACWSGTMIGYVAPGVMLGRAIEVVDPNTGCRWVFPVPAPLMREKDAMLVIEHPNYTLEIDGDSRIVHPAKEGLVDIVRDLPPETGWYEPEPKHGIPVRELRDPPRSFKRKNRGFLWRIEMRVGPIIRGDYNYGVLDNRQVVYACERPPDGDGPDHAFGVVAEAPG